MRVTNRLLLVASAAAVGMCVLVAPSLQGRFGAARGAGSGATSDASVRSSYEEALAIVNGGFAGPYEIDALNSHAVQGMLRSLDPHSTYFDAREFSELRAEQQSQFYGIGVTINRRNDRIYILSAIPGTPAEKAGLRYGDAIVSVDGKSTDKWSSDQILGSVRGERGKEVELTVERVGAPEPLTFTIVRDSVPLPTIRNAFMITPTVGYVGLVGGFSSTTDMELGRAVADLKSRGMQQLLLDLRRNPGGLLDEAIKVAERFLPAGQKILVVRGREGGSRGEVVYTSKNDAPETVPLVVLIDGGTASASEVVTGALQDHDRALVAGETSFGKGLVQTVFQLNFGAGVTVTTSKYYTPTGRSIQRDYSQTSFYDYYLHRTGLDADAEMPKGEPLLTDSGRTVYGGGGITPDLRLDPPPATAVKGRLFTATFEFARRLVAGEYANLREFRVERVDFAHRLRGDEFRITDAVVEEFRRYQAANADFAVPDEQVTANLDFVRNRVREEVITAAYGTEAGNQIFLQNDVQTQRAIEALPRARELAEAARAARDRN